MMTAYPTHETRVQATDLGASAYLTKPVEANELIKTIDSLLLQ
jgi:DNA-binding response OmpR family regulator